MKKLFVLFISLFSFLTISYAESEVTNVNFDIKHDYFDVTILDNGDAKVKELIVYDGSFNGITVDLCYKNNALSYDYDNFENSAIYNFTDIKDFKVRAKNISNPRFSDIFDNDYGFFAKKVFADKGDRFSYTQNDTEYGCHNYKIYHATRNKEVGFLLEYTLDDVVVVNNDVAEFYWQIFSPGEGRDKIRDVVVKVHLPQKDTKDNFRIWTHDILDSNIKYLDDYSGFVATADKVNDDDNFDVRATFSRDLILDDSTLDKRDIDGLDEILEVEEERAEQANLIREELRKTYNFYDKGGKVLTIATLLFSIVLLLKLKLKPRNDFYAKYYREFIEDYDVEVIDYLYHKKLTPNALTAATMNLVYKKIAKVEEIPSDKKKKEYKFTLLNKDNLSDSDQELVKLLFDRVGDGKEFTTSKLKSYSGSLSTGSAFNSQYNIWSKKVTKSGNEQNFFASKLVFGIATAIVAFVDFIFMSGAASNGVDSAFAYLPVPLSIVAIVICAATLRYNKKGALHLKKWNAFKNFLNDFGTFDIKELPEIHLWERYLVYATIFGLAKKVQGDMNVKIKELPDYNESTYTGNLYTNLYIHNAIANSFSRAYSDGKKTYYANKANAYSSSSSGGGFGGGGSFGGGFGGGGGGRGGF